MSPKLGYVGLGALGSPMAINLAKHSSTSLNNPFTIWNRSKDKYSAIQAEAPYVYEAGTVEEVVQKCDVIFTCLLNDAAAEDIYGKMLAEAKAGSHGKVIFVDQSTLSPTLSSTSYLIFRKHTSC